MQAIVAAEVGHLDLAYDYFGETAFVDLRDLNHNTKDGLHVASLAGTWLAAVCGFGGLRDQGEHLSFAPRLPARLVRLEFRLLFRGRRLRVDVRPRSACYELVDGEPLTVLHHGEEVGLERGRTLERRIPAIDPGPPPRQPPGREPRRRHVEA